jgi:streptogramin lyase
LARALILATLLLVAAAPAASAVTIDEFPAPGAPIAITSGPDANIWFTQLDLDRIGRMSTAGAPLGETQAPSGSAPSDIVAGPDGNLWFTAPGRDRVGRVTTGGTLLPEVTLPSGSEPIGIAVGSDGNLWVTEPGRSRIAQISPAGVLLDETVIPGGRAPEGITAGPDGALWFTEPENNRVGRITTAGAVTEYPLPNPGSAPIGIAAGPDGALWFTESDGNNIGRITTVGMITEFPLPTAESGPEDIAAGPDGNLWFTEAAAGKIGRITTAGIVTEFPVPTADSEPVGISAGPDGRMWFTEASANQIGRLTLDPPAAVTGDATGVSDTAATVTGTVDPNASATTYRFEYGPTAAYGSSTAVTSAGAGDDPVAVSAGLSGLQPGVTYHYRLVASSAVGTSAGADRTFTTGTPEAPPPPPAGGAPLLTAGEPTALRPTSVTLNGTLNPNGLPTSYWAECGRTTSYGTATPRQDAGAATGDQPISVAVTGLRPGTRYHCRLVATNSAGTAFGPDQAFRTPRELELVLPRSIVAQAGKPVTLRYRSSMTATVVARLTRVGPSPARLQRRLRTRARRGSNRLRLGVLPAGRYRLQVSATAAGDQRARGTVRIVVLQPPPPTLTG